MRAQDWLLGDRDESVATAAAETAERSLEAE